MNDNYAWKLINQSNNCRYYKIAIAFLLNNFLVWKNQSKKLLKEAFISIWCSDLAWENHMYSKPTYEQSWSLNISILRPQKVRAVFSVWSPLPRLTILGNILIFSIGHFCNIEVFKNTKAKVKEINFDTKNHRKLNPQTFSSHIH